MLLECLDGTNVLYKCVSAANNKPKLEEGKQLPFSGLLIEIRGLVIMKKLIKKIMPYRTYFALKSNPIRRDKKAKEWDRQNGSYCRDAINLGQRIFLLNTPLHTNLGDLAIAEAEIAYLKRIVPDELIVEISSFGKNIFGLDALKKIIPQNALLLFHGGGYIGTDWIIEEEAFRHAVDVFPNNRIVLFPQSVFYSNNKKGKEMLEFSKRVYARHKDLHLFARDKISYTLMKQYHPSANIYLAPDIVFTMEYSAVETRRSGVLICMRTDKEKLVTDKDILYIEKICKKYGHIEYTDTIALDYTGEIRSDTRGPLIKAKLEQFSRTSLIVTDRLHGMIFAAITGTPCVALSSHNHKIKGMAEWIKDLKYINYIDTISEFEAAAVTTSYGPGQFDRDIYLPHFSELEKIILNKPIS